MPYKRISIDEAKVLIGSSTVTIADVRAADAYSAGCIDNAVHIQQDTLEDFVASAAKDAPLIIYCYHGNSSQSAADFFSEQGFEDVYSVDGGYEAWRQKY